MRLNYDPEGFAVNRVKGDAELDEAIYCWVLELTALIRNSECEDLLWRKPLVRTSETVVCPGHMAL